MQAKLETLTRANEALARRLEIEVKPCLAGRRGLRTRGRGTGARA
jgi:hypothetical protein